MVKAARAKKTAGPALRAKNRKSLEGVNISPNTRLALHGLARALPKPFKEDSGLLLPFITYFQDPFVAKADPSKAFDEKVLVAWEPGLTDGPTSSRFADRRLQRRHRHDSNRPRCGTRTPQSVRRH